MKIYSKLTNMKTIDVANEKMTRFSIIAEEAEQRVQGLDEEIKKAESIEIVVEKIQMLTESTTSDMEELIRKRQLVDQVEKKINDLSSLVISLDVSNWSEYDRSLRSRGDLTIWLSEDVIDAWVPEQNGKRGRQRKYSDISIEAALSLRLAFHLTLRQTACVIG